MLKFLENDFVGLGNYGDLLTIVVITIAVYLGLYHILLKNEILGITQLEQRQMKPQYFNLLFVLAGVFIFKAIMAVNSDGYVSDMNCFRGWSDMVYDHGIGQFYRIDEGNGYPPGYMLILWFVAVLRHLFGIEWMDGDGEYTGSGLLLIKLFPILFDLAAGALIYVMAKKRFSELASLALCVIYTVSPVVVLDSSTWGQVDSVFTFMVLLTCYLCMKEKRIPAYFVFCAGALLKFQTIMFAPILIYTIVEQVFLKDFNVKKMLRDLAGGLGAIASMFLVAAPFGLDVVIPKYINSLGLFEYCTVNAYNVWAVFGKNWAPQTDKFLFLEAQQWGNIAIVMSVALSALVFFKWKEDKSKYFLSMAVLIGTMFLFSVRMHERYLFPAIVLVLAGFIYRPCKELLFVHASYGLLQFLNVFHVYYTWEELQTTGPGGYLIGFTAVMTLFTYAYLFYAVFRKADIRFEPSIATNRRGKKRQLAAKAPVQREKYKFEIRPSRRMGKFDKFDWIVLGVIIAVYSCVALYDLGDRHAPETSWEANQAGSQIVLDFGETKDIANLYVFAGSYEGRIFEVETSDDGVNYTGVGKMTVEAVFRWNTINLTNTDEQTGETSEGVPFSVKARWIRMTLSHNEEILKEMVFTDAQGNRILPANAGDYPELFDEQDEFDPTANFRTGTYFDEVYHARTAYEMIHKMYNYENTHPPLGKFFISLGIRAFGMNPFGWRIVGTLFGIAMIPFLYLFGKRIFRKTWMAAVVTVLFTFDFMHFTQTRISTIDVYGTFFIIAMFFFMYWYSQTSFYDTDFKKTLIPLGLSGLMMGLGCASKWTAIYAGAGLGIFFLAIMICRFAEYYTARNNPRGSTAGISHEHIVEVFPKYLKWTLLFCVLFFIVIPGTIYTLSYIPFSDGIKSNAERFTSVAADTNISGIYRGFAGFLKDREGSFWDLVGKMVRNQYTMFTYHAGLETGHPYSSTWYEWPFMIRPMFYYCKTVADGLKEGISAFGNPMVWWTGIFATVYTAWCGLKKRDRTAIFLVFAYLVQYVPWILVPRCTFAYHYFPSVPFVVLMIGYALYSFIGDDRKKRRWAYVYCAGAVGLFAMFYPVLSGHPVSMEYISNGLKWLSGWVLTL